MKVDDLGNMMPNVVRDTNDSFVMMFCQSGHQIFCIVSARRCHNLERNLTRGVLCGAYPTWAIVLQNDGEYGRSVWSR